MSFAEKMTAIADAIRDKTGKTDKLSLDEMATEISEISTGESAINPEWTHWRHFAYNGYRDSILSHLKYNDTSNGTDFMEMIYANPNLTEIPVFDTGNGTSFYYFIYNCPKVTSIPEFDTSKGDNFQYMLGKMTGLTSIPEFDTSNGTKFGYMFTGCTNLVTIPKLDFSKATSSSSLSGAFNNCKALVNLNIVGTINATGLKVQDSPLSHDSLMSIINALADKTSDTSGTTWKVTLGSDNLAKLTTEEIAIAEGKGWTLA